MKIIKEKTIHNITVYGIEFQRTSKIENDVEYIKWKQVDNLELKADLMKLANKLEQKFIRQLKLERVLTDGKKLEKKVEPIEERGQRDPFGGSPSEDVTPPNHNQFYGL